MKVKEIRRMDMSDLRNQCINHGWFTRGDCDEYDKFLKMTGRNMTTARLLTMARIIMSYSDPEIYEMLELSGVLYCLADICHTCFSVEE